MDSQKINPTTPASQAEPVLRSISLVRPFETSTRSPKEMVEDTLFAFAQAVRSQGADLANPDALRGFVVGFCLEYPTIHNAVVARELLDEATSDLSTFLSKGAEYFQDLEDIPNGDMPEGFAEFAAEPEEADERARNEYAQELEDAEREAEAQRQAEAEEAESEASHG